MDKKCHIFAHLVNNETCKTVSIENCFEIIDSASTPFKIKVKRSNAHNLEEAIT